MSLDQRSRNGIGPVPQFRNRAMNTPHRIRRNSVNTLFIIEYKGDRGCAYPRQSSNIILRYPFAPHPCFLVSLLL